MAAVNTRLLLEKFDVAKARIKTLHEAGKVSPEVDAVIGVLLTLLNILITVLPEKTTSKTNTNSSNLPSQTGGADNTAKGAGKGRRRHNAGTDLMDQDGFRTFVIEDTFRVSTCESCGADLKDWRRVAANAARFMTSSSLLQPRHLAFHVPGRRPADCKVMPWPTEG